METSATKVTNKKTKKNKLLYTFFLIGFCIAIGILLYPPFTDMLSRYLQMISIGQYAGDYLNLSEEEISKLKSDAIEYNLGIYEKQMKTPFMYEGEDYDDPEYDQILKVSKYNKIMANVEVPLLNIYIPVVHGTKAEDLNINAGHMHGTSVPIGGINTHAVIAAHTGLRSADLFSNLTELKEGDEFYIHVLNEIRIYEIDQMLVILPSEANEHLRIVPGEEYVTLYTCTPYGINSHRLLVRGKFVRSIPANGRDGDEEDILARRIKMLILTILIGLIPFIILGIGLYLIHRKKSKKKKEEKKQITTTNNNEKEEIEETKTDI